MDAVAKLGDWLLPRFPNLGYWWYVQHIKGFAMLGFTSFHPEHIQGSTHKIQQVVQEAFSIKAYSFTHIYIYIYIYII